MKSWLGFGFVSGGFAASALKKDFMLPGLFRTAWALAQRSYWENVEGRLTKPIPDWAEHDGDDPRECTGKMR